MDSFDMLKPPTKEQARILKRFIESNRGEVVIDLENGLGELARGGGYYSKAGESFSKEYPRGTSSTKILKDINDFYAGTKKQIPTSKVQQFHDSERGSFSLRPLKDNDPISEYKKIGRLGYALSPISTNLERINPALKYGKASGLRGVESNILKTIKEDSDKAVPLLKKIKTAIKGDDLKAFDLARKNSDAATLQKYIIKYKLGKEYHAVRKMLDDIYKRAVAVGRTPEYMEHYHPRMIKDSEGLVKYLYDTEQRGMFDEAYKAAEKRLERSLTVDEKAVIANSVLRGYRGNQIKLAEPGSMKAREIETLDKDTDKFYYDADTSLIKYIEVMNKDIEARKFFGLTKNEGGKKDVIDNPLMDTELDKSIGEFVSKAVEEHKLSPAQENDLIAIMQARFNYKPMSGVFRKIKETGYLTAMGSGISSTISQLGDLAYSFYYSPLQTPVALGRAIAGKSKVKVSDLGINNIAEEFSDASTLASAVRNVFRLTGLTKLDFIFKENNINALMNKWGKQSRAGKPDAKLKYMVEAIFGKEGAKSVYDDLANGRVTDDVRMLMFNHLADIQPAALSEYTMEQLTKKHLGEATGFAYMMKTYWIKQLDVVRREAIWEIKKGNVANGMEKLTALIALLTISNAGPDAIKDYIFRRKTKWDQFAVDETLKLIGLSRYFSWQVRQNGVPAALMKLIAPPLSIIEMPVRDALKFKSAYDKSVKKNKPIDYSIKDMKTWSMTPLVGQSYNWWIGAGRTQQDKLNKPKESANPNMRPKTINLRKKNPILREKKIILKPKGAVAR